MILHRQCSDAPLRSVQMYPWQALRRARRQGATESAARRTAFREVRQAPRGVVFGVARLDRCAGDGALGPHTHCRISPKPFIFQWLFVTFAEGMPGDEAFRKTLGPRGWRQLPWAVQLSDAIAMILPQVTLTL